MNNFFQNKPVIGMIHLQALPGTPKSTLSVKEIIRQACREAEIYQSLNLDAFMIENMHDVPYSKGSVGPEITAVMTIVAREVNQIMTVPGGIQVLAGANREALAAALAAELSFIRVENFIYSHIADEGFIDACAADLLRYRKLIGAEQIMIFSDIKKKHCSHNITADINIAEAARTAEFFLSDGIIITGKFTASPPTLQELKDARNATKLPILIGSGINANNIAAFWESADGFIVGSAFKEGGYWQNPLSKEHIKEIISARDKLKEKNRI